MLYKAFAALPSYVLPFYFAFTAKSSSEFIFILISLAFALIALPSIILKYYYFTFSINDKEIIIKSGVFARNQRNIPFEKIQNVFSEQNFLARILGITKLSIETAGDLTTEGLLEFVSLKNAKIILETIKHFQTEAQTQIKLVDDLDAPISEEVEPKLTDSNEKLIYSLDIKNLFIYGMLNFRPALLILAFWFLSYISQFFQSELDIYSDNVKVLYNTYITQHSYIELGLLVSFGLFIAFLLSWIFDILLTVNSYYNFKLTKQNNKLYVSRGLINKSQGTIPINKLQMLVITTNFFREKLNYFGLNLETAGFGGKMMKNPEVAVPFAKFDVIYKLASSIYSFEFPTEFKKVSKKSIRRSIIRYLILLIPIGFASFYFFNMFLWVILFIPIVSYLAILQWQFRGYVVSENKVFIKQGFWNQKITIIPLEKIQTISVYSSIFQRLIGLSSINIDTAATTYTNDASIIDIESEESLQIFMELSKSFHKLKAEKILKLKN
ncbi:MAG: PH domain-containing protein [Candidatus Kapabacteria bacterium]|nr:PH domain-containing protein [Candidatus Kapabacteria bacterium]